MIISEQVKELREIAVRQRNNAKVSKKVFSDIENAFFKAAGTIESLFRKLKTSNNIIEKMAEEIENLYGKETELTEKARNYLDGIERLINCDGGWILCNEQMPEEHDSIFAELKGTEKWDDAMFEKTSDDVDVTVEYENGKRKTMTLHTIDGRWKTDSFAKFKVIAWQPRPEPYHKN